MPHSSGGGSHSGGSHSGSGFSSSSSSSGGSSAKHIKHTSFPGARRYVYYENYHPVYVYADYDIRKGTASGKVWSIIGSAVSLLFGIMLIALCYDKPQKMDTSPSYHCEIKDTAGVIDDMDKVQNAIVDFYDETGIPVEIMTVNNEDWQGSYSKLEEFAYDMYVTEFDDEEHWLVVYSEPASPDPDFNDWYWEGMQGDDTDNIITVDVADDFKDLMQKYLTANSRYDVSSAIAAAFDETTPNVMDGHVEWLFVIWGLLLSGIGAYEIYQTLITNKRTPANTAEMSMLSALVMSAHTAEHRSDHITWKQNSLSQMLKKNKKGVNNKCHIHREAALTEEDHTEARITAAIRTEAQEEAHAT